MKRRYPKNKLSSLFSAGVALTENLSVLWSPVLGGTNKSRIRLEGIWPLRAICNASSGTSYALSSPGRSATAEGRSPLSIRESLGWSSPAIRAVSRRPKPRKSLRCRSNAPKFRRLFRSSMLIGRRPIVVTECLLYTNGAHVTIIAEYN